MLTTQSVAHNGSSVHCRRPACREAGRCVGGLIRASRWVSYPPNVRHRAPHSARSPRPQPSRSSTAPLSAALRADAARAFRHYVTLTRTSRQQSGCFSIVPLSAPRGRSRAFFHRVAFPVPVGRVPCAPSPRRSARRGRLGVWRLTVLHLRLRRDCQRALRRPPRPGTASWWAAGHPA